MTDKELNRLIAQVRERRFNEGHPEIIIKRIKKKPGRKPKPRPQVKLLREAMAKVDIEFTRAFIRNKKIERMEWPTPSPVKEKEVTEGPKTIVRPPAIYSNTTPYGIAADYLQHPDKYEEKK